MVDFSKLSRPKSRVAPVDPIEIFKRTPNTGDVPNDLWKGQADALALWHSNRSQSDNLIILNTGAGKSIVGLMAAQSLINEGKSNILFVCSTIDLVEQTAKEAESLGLTYTKRVGGEYSDDKFETGKSFCIATYQSLFTSTSPFKKIDLGGIIFDDAHVAEGLIRDSLTVKISRQVHGPLYDKIVEILRPEFEHIKKSEHFRYILEEENNASTLCPPLSAKRNSSSILELFNQYKFRNHKDLFFPIMQIYENISCCAIYLSSKEIEIAPPFIPNSHFSHINNCSRRIYLSATLDYTTDFIRAFGVEKIHRIEPNNDAGNGERLIILGSLLEDRVGKLEVAKDLTVDTKVVVSVPSYRKAMEWSSLCTPPKVENFSLELDEFRRKATGAFCLVSRVDGIDLPKDTCRIMIIDGCPGGTNLQERYQVEVLSMMSQNATKMSTRLTQLLGRINRGRSDYGAFILYGNDLNNWCKNDRNIALLPELIRKQFLLGSSLQEQIGKSSNKDISKLIRDVLGVNENKNRSKSWLEFYGDTIDGLEIDNNDLDLVREREKNLAIGALAESRFMGALWHGDIEAAREQLLAVIDNVAPVDSKLAGWYDLWLGMTYESEGDSNSASTHYSRARSRLTAKLNVPLIRKFQAAAEELTTLNPVQRNLAELNTRGARQLSDFARELRRAVSTVSKSTNSSNQREEACRLVGELLGFETARPDNVFKKGPDVIWSSEDDNTLIAFELKTQKKDTQTTYKKDEIGQCLNHLEWIEENYPKYQFDGVTIIGPQGEVSRNSSPGDRIFLSTVEEFCNTINLFIARIDTLVGMTELERWHMVKDLGIMPEFQLKGFGTTFAQRKLRNMQ